MTLLNENYLNLQGSYLFAEVARRTAAYKKAHPDAQVLSLVIGDVSHPLVPADICVRGFIMDSGSGALQEVL